ncbi:Heat shock protein GrpE [hydrothermal vent metagenome]|uniref:Heat shock protein GrpE n=1 Tax=hydrothermal vent metagenome TaxID=652676 RepID=A0A1W1ELE8_9ZZZZ
MSDKTEQSKPEEEIENPLTDEIEMEEEKAPEVDELEKAKAEALEYKNKYLRAYADFENSKRLMQKDKNAAVAYSNEKFATDILGVLDSFEQAINTINAVEVDEESEVLTKIKEGVDLTFQQLKKVLEKNHITEINCEGELDPNLHQAIMQVESDEHESGHIVSVMQKGYMIKDRVLRSPMVSTAK